MLTGSKLERFLSYDPETGIFCWKIDHKYNRRAGGPAGSPLNGYIVITVDRKQVLAHRLAWLWMTGIWPDSRIDHVDGNPSNNRWGNLRLATQSQNIANSKRRSDNASGFKGVSWHKTNGKYQARIEVRGRRVALGYFKTPEEAHAAYAKAAQSHYGEFARIS